MSLHSSVVLLAWGRLAAGGRVALEGRIQTDLIDRLHVPCAKCLTNTTKNVSRSCCLDDFWLLYIIVVKYYTSMKLYNKLYLTQ